MGEGALLGILRLFSDKKYKTINTRIGKQKITLEIADDSYKRAKGLMYRRRLSDNKGMLFVFSSEKRYSFWMMNMRFSIDILWLDKNSRIVDITKRAEPAESFFSAGSYRPKKPVMYAIEVRSGFADSSGTMAGDIIGLKGL